MILPSDLSNHHKELDFILSSNSEEYKETLSDCLKTFTLYSPTTKINLDHYFLLYWDTAYFLSSLEGFDKSYITRNGIRYYIVYMEMLSPEYISAYQTVRLSFRKPKFLSFGFVLVRSTPNKTR